MGTNSPFSSIIQKKEEGSFLCLCERSVAISYKERHYEERSDVVISYGKYIYFYEIASLHSQ